MNFSFNFLCWMSSGLLLCSWGVAAGDFGPSSSSHETNSSAPVALRGYRRYFANDSLIGRPVPCTRDDKICFRHNLIFDPTLDRCEVFDASIYSTYRINRMEINHGSGRVFGTTPEYQDPCTGYRMAYDGLCYEKGLVHCVICGRQANLTRHPFGGVECREAPPTPITVHQPEEDGSCVIPDLRFPDAERHVFFDNPSTETQGFKNDDPLNSVKANALECSSDQSVCFSQRRVFVTGYEGCHKLLEQGPCEEDHVVALDAQAAAQGRAEGTCVHVRGGCPRGHKRMIFDGECHEDRKVHLVAPGDITLNQFGSYIVVPDLLTVNLFPALKYGNCEINLADFLFEVASSPLLPPCGNDNKGNCKLYEVINEPPLPEL